MDYASIAQFQRRTVLGALDRGGRDQSAHKNNDGNDDNEYVAITTLRPNRRRYPSLFFCYVVWYESLHDFCFGFDHDQTFTPSNVWQTPSEIISQILCLVVFDLGLAGKC